jgi:hypothetical protein
VVERPAPDPPTCCLTGTRLSRPDGSRARNYWARSAARATWPGARSRPAGRNLRAGPRDDLRQPRVMATVRGRSDVAEPRRSERSRERIERAGALGGDRRRPAGGARGAPGVEAPAATGWWLRRAVAKATVERADKHPRDPDDGDREQPCRGGQLDLPVTRHADKRGVARPARGATGSDPPRDGPTGWASAAPGSGGDARCCSTGVTRSGPPAGAPR